MMKTIQNEPVLSASAVIGAIMAVLTALIALGVINITPEQTSAIEAVLVAIVPLLVTLAGGWVARRYVTPVANPRNNAGEQLVPADNA